MNSSSLNTLLQLKNGLYRLALRITLNPQDAEDIVQDTIIKLWNRRDHWSEIDSLDAFAMTSCRNLALDCLKRREHQNLSLDTIPLDRPDLSPDPIDKMQREDNLNQIRQVMATLPEAQRTCMHLRDFESKSYKEIAEIVGITEENVKVNIFRARKAVKEKILDPSRKT